MRVGSIWSLALCLFACGQTNSPQKGGLDRGPSSVPEVEDPVPEVPGTREPEPVPTSEDRDPNCSAEAGWLVSLGGRIETPSGEPITGASAQTCLRAPSGTLACLRPAQTNGVGVFEQSIPDRLRCVDRAAMRALDSSARGTTVYCALVQEFSEVNANLSNAIVLHKTRGTIELPAIGHAGEIRAARLEDNSILEVAPEIFPDVEDYLSLSSIHAPGDAQPCWAGHDFDGLLGFYPEVDFEAGTASLNLKLAHRRVEGETAEVFVLGGLSCTDSDGQTIEEAHWESLGEVSVSSDGDFLGGIELPCLSWVAYRF